jgi:hypothetical protein
MEGKIYQNIIKAMNEVNSISKDNYNKIQNFKFRGIDDVMNTMHPILSKNNIFVAPEVESFEREERTSKNGGLIIYTVATIKLTFYAEDGSNIIVKVVGEAMDSGDKGMNKAMSIAYKYALFQVFCIPTEDDPDKDSYTLAPKQQTNKNTKTSQLAKQTAKQQTPKQNLITKEQKETLINLIESAGLILTNELPKINSLTVDRYDKALDYYTNLVFDKNTK